MTGIASTPRGEVALPLRAERVSYGGAVESRGGVEARRKCGPEAGGTRLANVFVLAWRGFEVRYFYF